MENNGNNKRELVLEVEKDGYRRLIFRTDIGNGTTLFLERTDLVDFSRPVADNDDYNVFFTKGAFWKAFTEFTSIEGLSKRQVWHEPNFEWLHLKPVFVHDDIKKLIRRSLSEVSRSISPTENGRTEAIRTWLQHLSGSTTVEMENLMNPFKSYRHAV